MRPTGCARVAKEACHGTRARCNFATKQFDQCEEVPVRLALFRFQEFQVPGACATDPQCSSFSGSRLVKALTLSILGKLCVCSANFKCIFTKKKRMTSL